MNNAAQASPSPGSFELPEGVQLLGPRFEEAEGILTYDALAFAAGLERRFGNHRRELLALRETTQAQLDAGWRPDFLNETRSIRESGWRIDPTPTDLLDRRVEITGPVDRKMVVNALNSGANLYMADFEDSNSPTWENCVRGQKNLYDAIRRQIDFKHPETGKEYKLAEKTATLLVRPRGWHLVEKNVVVDGRPMSAALFDFALFFYHNAHALLQRGTGPYFYLPKMEGHIEARLWNDVFLAAQEELGIPRGTVKATVLIETILAAFEMDEILWELREHSAGLNCGRWDYIFSFIKRFRSDANFVLPDRGLVGMDQHFLRSYSQLLIQTCHRRGAHAMGGMAAQIPIKGDDERNQAALDKVRADKRREANDGHDGTWVAHPGLVALAREELDAVLDGQNQLGVLREDVQVTAADLLTVPQGPVTEAGLRQNLEVGVRYLAAWLTGSGCVPIHHLMEDAATAEISRTQVWQWVRHGAQLDDGRVVTAELAKTVLGEEMDKLRLDLGPEAFRAGEFPRAIELFEDLITKDELEEFLTLVAYEHV
ncbi:MAG: malate synthase A [Planctomycetota bacterium]